MAIVFRRRVPILLWAIAFFTVALSAPPPLVLMPPATLFVLALVGVVLIVVTMPGAMSWLRTSRSVVRVLPSRHRDKTSAET
jgi:hypothetical protein